MQHQVETSCHQFNEEIHYSSLLITYYRRQYSYIQKNIVPAEPNPRMLCYISVTKVRMKPVRARELEPNDSHAFIRSAVFFLLVLRIVARRRLLGVPSHLSRGHPITLRRHFRYCFQRDALGTIALLLCGRRRRRWQYLRYEDPLLLL